ncbi:M14-type cytosolic carboxypeptidase [Litorimonas sp. RW-G-Af-16]|uniref:M14 family metallopeptidase n=1 Tax=Litorimonas sp. RW-G-Af-16 TaxID=3241168 RepID=UPI00390CABFF
MMLHISSAFDSGNIVVKDMSDPRDIRLNIRKDTKSDFYQWFYFRITGAKGQACRMVIENAKGAAFVGGWDGYKAVASYDRDDWFRIPTTRYENGQLIIEVTPEQDSLYIAYFAPYSMERHADLIAECVQQEGVSLNVIGHSIEGQSLDCLIVGEGPKPIWVIARQHPGESMAEWWMEGFLSRLLDTDDDVAMSLRKAATFYVVPNMNPDGSCRGNLRTNVNGANLNREWGVATLENSPEVLHTIAAMDKAKPVLCLDVHGDESLPYNFIAGAEGIPGYTEKQAKDLADFLSAYKKASPDFQTKHGYATTAPGKANLTMCTNFTAHRYDCLAMTLEMPFKDNADYPDESVGWSPDRAAQLGFDALNAIRDVVEQL